MGGRSETPAEQITFNILQKLMYFETGHLASGCPFHLPLYGHLSYIIEIDIHNFGNSRHEFSWC